MLLFKHIKFLILPFFLFALFTSKGQTKKLNSYETSSLKIEALTNNIFIHTSYLFLPKYGKIGCNGMIYINNNEAFIFDTPTTDSVSIHVINWIESKLKCKVVGILASHFHNDCLGGLKTFNDKGIKSYGHDTTIALAKADNVAFPLYGFENEAIIPVGNSYVTMKYFGEGHTKDNVIAYIGNESVLFGGCLIKELDAKKGYLGDANVKEWSKTVAQIKVTYPNLKYVIPGHGKTGDTKLLDYTIELFKQE